MIWKLLLALFACVLAGIGVYLAWPYLNWSKRADYLPGTVETQEVRLSSRVGGRVAKLQVREGDLVQPGAIILTLDLPELDAQKSQLEAQIAQSEAVLLRLKNGPRTEEIAAAKAAKDAAQAQHDLMKDGFRSEEVAQARNEMLGLDAEMQQASQELERQRSLLTKSPGSTSISQYDAAVGRFGRIQGQYNAANERLKMMEKGRRPQEIAAALADFHRAEANYQLLLAGTRPEDIAEAGAKVEQLKAQLAELEIRRQERTVVAPEAARVEVLSCHPGDIVGPNQPVARMLRAEDLWVKAYIPETELGRIRTGQRVQVTCDTFPGQKFSGEIVSIASASEFTPRNVQTIDERRHQVFGFKVRVDDPQGVFKSGMAAEVWLTP